MSTLSATEIQYNIVSKEGEPVSVSCFIDGQLLMAQRDHRMFLNICEALQTGLTTGLKDLFDPGTAIAKRFESLSERVSVANGRIYLDGVQIESALTSAIMAFYGAGIDDYTALVNFMEKVYTNPNPHSIEHLFRWLKLKQFSIHPDGDIVAYKGIESNDVSSHAGTAMVNGEVIIGQIPNKAGTIIEMPRDVVTFDPARGCHVGLHVGNWNYARTFASKVVQVKVNPRDVVSVPVDHGDQKMRVCRYKVLNVVSAFATDVLHLDRDIREMKTFVTAKAVAPAVGLAKKAPSKRVNKKAAAPAKKAALAKAPKPPKWYEDFTQADFEQVPVSDLRWLASEWEILTSIAAKSRAKPELIGLLLKEANSRNRLIARASKSVKLKES